MKKIELILSPALFQHRTIREGCIHVIIDVLRATTSFNAVFEAGAKSIIPVPDLDRLQELKVQGYLTAAEREGKKVSFADYGNSPSVFLNSDLKGMNLAYSTTNGTQAIELVKHSGEAITACFSNLNAVISYLASRDKDILILCSGWKNAFSLEDSVCAGAIADAFISRGTHEATGDAVLAALSLWAEAADDLQFYCSKGSHYKRLQKLGLAEDLAFCFRKDTSAVVPCWNGEFLVPLQ